MTDNREGKGSVEEHRQESGRTEEQRTVPTPKPLTLEQHLAFFSVCF